MCNLSNLDAALRGGLLSVIEVQLMRVGAGPTLGERLHWMAWSSLREPGCVEYSVHVDLDDPDRYVLYE